ncbi:HEAT repeat domain-containing protein [Pedobacter panaciterrae]
MKNSLNIISFLIVGLSIACLSQALAISSSLLLTKTVNDSISNSNILTKNTSSTITATPNPLYVFCGTGDHLFSYDKEPVNSSASLESMVGWMSETYNVKRIYWRGGQEELMYRHFKFGKASVPQYDYNNWAKNLYQNNNLNGSLITSAKRNGMEVFMYTGLFEYGVQPDVGIIQPYLFEDELRINHPEWVPQDRWGTRRAPGPISFSYPAARKAIIDRLMNYLNEYNYDGITFYSYVENLGIRYVNEFGFDGPVLNQFKKLYPNVDIKKDSLTKQQSLSLYKIQGEFVTNFFSEFHAQLEAKNKKLSIILDSKEPNYPQPWWGKSVRGTGMIYMDWETWIKRGIVDEIWVQLGEFKDQAALLDKLLKATSGKSIKLVVRTPSPFAAYWKKYISAGVIPIAVITSPKNGIEEYSKRSKSANLINSKDWKSRIQSLKDDKGNMINNDNAISSLAKDHNLLVRRTAIKSIGKLKKSGDITILENALNDSELSVKIEAIAALSKINGNTSIENIINTVSRSDDFPLKGVAQATLSSFGVSAIPNLINNLNSSNLAVKEVCIRALTTIGRTNLTNDIFNKLRSIMNNKNEAYNIRWWAIEGLGAQRLKMSPSQKKVYVTDLLANLSQSNDQYLQLELAQGISIMNSFLEGADRQRALSTLSKIFLEYGDGSTRQDAAYGWRVIGNAMKILGANGAQQLESYRAQKNDKWLAWVAYEVLYVEQKKTNLNQGFCLVNENEAIRIHNKYAPAFPGYRKW